MLFRSAIRAAAGPQDDEDHGADPSWGQYPVIDETDELANEGEGGSKRTQGGRFSTRMIQIRG